jgi:hypothetical protein
MEGSLLSSSGWSSPSSNLSDVLHSLLHQKAHQDPFSSWLLSYEISLQCLLVLHPEPKLETSSRRTLMSAVDSQVLENLHNTCVRMLDDLTDQAKALTQQGVSEDDAEPILRPSSKEYAELQAEFSRIWPVSVTPCPSRQLT